MSPEIVLTPAQTHCQLSINAFVADPTKKVMVLEGFAGTGKSTLIERLLDDLPKAMKMLKVVNPEIELWPIELTATTHKACDNLALITGAEVHTLHHFLGLKVQRDFTTGQTKLVNLEKNPVGDGTILIIDEVSQIDDYLLDIVLFHMQNGKVLFIGDPAQLLAVKASNAPVFQRGFETVALTAVMRQAEGNPIIAAATKMRESVYSGVLSPISLDGKHLRHLNAEDFYAEMGEEFSSPDWNYSTSKVLAWTNNAVLKYNREISKHVGGEAELKAGDFVVCNSYIKTTHCHLRTDALVRVAQINSVINRGITGWNIALTNGMQAFMPANWPEASKLVKKLRLDNQYTEAKHIEETWIDLRAPYACTINKSQGSTYDKVFIDLNDMKKCRQVTQLARLLYVGISRARNHVIFTGDLV